MATAARAAAGPVTERDAYREVSVDPNDRSDSSDHRDRNDSAEPTDAAQPPDRIEPADHSDQRDVPEVVMTALSATRRDRYAVRLTRRRAAATTIPARVQSMRPIPARPATFAPASDRSVCDGVLAGPLPGGSLAGGGVELVLVEL
jgi:hypothetical protein